MRQLKVDPKFRDKIPALSAEEFERLEENILADGEVREPLVVWNDTIIDGHHRWQIIQKHPEIPYRVKDMAFADEWAAIVWMCRNQLGRRNLNEAQRMAILADQYEAQKKTSGGQIRNGNAKKRHLQSEGVVFKKPRGTAEIVAKDAGVSTVYVERAVRFSRGLAAADKVSPGFKDAVLSGEVNVPKATIAELRNLPEEDVARAVEEIKKPKRERVSIKSINASIAQTRDKDREIEYTIEDFLAEIQCVHNDYIRKVQRMFDMYRDIATDNAEIVLENMTAAAAEFEKIMEVLK